MMQAVLALSNDSFGMIRHLTFASLTYLRDFDIRSELLVFDYITRVSWSLLLYFLKDHLHLELVSINFIDLGCYAAPGSTVIEWRRITIHSPILWFFAWSPGLSNLLTTSRL